MLREMAKSKIHRATVTEANLNYEGSITVDSALLATADIYPGERVQVVNIANGARFETYAIEGEAGSGIVCVNGAAARLTQPGDLVIDLLGRGIGIIAVLNDFAPQENHLLALGVVERPKGVAHAPAAHHLFGQSGGHLDVVGRAGADAVEDDFLGHAAAVRHR